MSVRDTNGWTWGGVLKGVAYTTGILAVGFAVAVGVSTGLAAMGVTGVANFLAGGAVTATTPLGQIPGLIVDNVMSGVSSFFTPAVEAVTGAVGQARTVAEGAVGTVTSKATEYAVPAAAAAGGAVVAGAYMYGKGKDAGVKQAVGKFTQGELERRAHANIAQGQGI